MNKIRRIAALCMILSLLFIISSCASGEIPTEEPTSVAENKDVYNPFKKDETAKPADEKIEDKKETEATSIVPDSVEIVYNNYYKYGENYVKVYDFRIDNEHISSKAKGYFDAEMLRIGRRSADVKIAYTSYDADGNVIRNSFSYIDLDGIKVGEKIEKVRFDVPYNAVKVVFNDFSE